MLQFSRNIFHGTKSPRVDSVSAVTGASYVMYSYHIALHYICITWYTPSYIFAEHMAPRIESCDLTLKVTIDCPELFWLGVTGQPPELRMQGNRAMVAARQRLQAREKESSFSTALSWRSWHPLTARMVCCCPRCSLLSFYRLFRHHNGLRFQAFFD